MSLAERLEQARRGHVGANDVRRTGPPRRSAGGCRPVRRGEGERPPGADRQPRAAAVRPAPASSPTSSSGCGSRCRRSSSPRRRRCRRPTAPASPRTSATRSSATARWSRCCATPRSPRSWSTARTRSTSSARARSSRSPASFTNDAHLRRTIDKIVGRVGRRVDEAQPDGRRPPARRLPGQRGHPADRPRRLAC